MENEVRRSGRLAASRSTTATPKKAKGGRRKQVPPPTPTRPARQTDADSISSAEELGDPGANNTQASQIETPPLMTNSPNPAAVKGATATMELGAERIVGQRGANVNHFSDNSLEEVRTQQETSERTEPDRI